MNILQIFVLKFQKSFILVCYSLSSNKNTGSPSFFLRYMRLEIKCSPLVFKCSFFSMVIHYVTLGIAFIEAFIFVLHDIITLP